MNQIPASEVTQAQKDERLWATLVHICPLVGLAFIGPLIIMLVKPFNSEFVHHHAKQQLILDVVTLAVVLISIPLTIVLIGFLTMFAMGILNIVGCIIAAIRANEGVWYRFPLIGGSS